MQSILNQIYIKNKLPNYFINILRKIKRYLGKSSLKSSSLMDCCILIVRLLINGLKRIVLSTELRNSIYLKNNTNHNKKSSKIKNKKLKDLTLMIFGQISNKNNHLATMISSKEWSKSKMLTFLRNFGIKWLLKASKVPYVCFITLKNNRM